MAKRGVARKPRCAKAKAAIARPIRIASDGRGLSAQAGEVRQSLRHGGAEIDRKRIGRRDAHEAGQTAHGHHCGDADDKEGNDGTQIAAADLAQRAHAAGAVQRHAEPEYQAAEDQRAEFEPRADIDRLGQVEPAENLKQMHADDRDADGQQPGAKPARIVRIDRILDRAERAETPAPRHEAEARRQGRSRAQAARD